MAEAKKPKISNFHSEWGGWLFIFYSNSKSICLSSAMRAWLYRRRVIQSGISKRCTNATRRDSLLTLPYALLFVACMCNRVKHLNTSLYVCECFIHKKLRILRDEIVSFHILSFVSRGNTVPLHVFFLLPVLIFHPPRTGHLENHRTAGHQGPARFADGRHRP